MLELKNVNCRVQRHEILRGVSLGAQSGETVALLGKNGSGKTTLLRAICGELDYAGDITFNGSSLKTMPRRLRAQRVGLMPQTLPVPRVAVEELVMFGRSPYIGISGAAGAADREAVRAAMETAGVGAYRGRAVDTLSGGERQRCFFAMLLAQNADLLLLDEPTANLDAEYRELLHRDIRALRAAGKTVLAVMHDLAEACRAADRLYVLDAGRVVFSGTPDEFARSDAPADIFRMRVCECPDTDGTPLRFFTPLR